MSVSPTDLQAVDDGLKKSIAKLEKTFNSSMTTLAAQSTTANASTLLGLDFQAKQYESRRNALLDPANYARDRSTAFDEMKRAINEKHTDAI